MATARLGFLMSAAKLLEERPQPDGDEVRQALPGTCAGAPAIIKLSRPIELAASQTGGSKGSSWASMGAKYREYQPNRGPSAKERRRIHPVWRGVAVP